MILVMLTAVVCLSGCSGIKKVKDLKVTSAKICSISPKGLTAIDLCLHVGIENPGVQISLSDISCDVKRFGKILGNVAVDPFTLHARTEEIYDLKAVARLGDEVSLIDLGRFIKNMSTDDLTADLHVKVKLRGGIYKNVSYKDIPLKKLIEKTAKK